MLVRRVKNGYEFESPTNDGAFIVRLMLTDSGKEKLETCPVGVAVSFKARVLPPGTIKNAIGPERWKNFLHAREKGIATMFIDPHKPGSMPLTW